MGETGMDNGEMLQAVAQKRDALLQGDAARIARQHADGKCTARERVAKLFDAGSFMEMDTLRADSNLIAGCGTIGGQAVYCFAQDYTAAGGAMTKAQTAKILKTLNAARVTGAPVVALMDSEGVKITDGADAMPAYAQVLSAMARMSGVSPMICCVMGPCRGLATLLTQVCDITVQVEKTGKIALHTALVMNAEKGKDKTEDQLFGAAAMAAQGVAALTAQSEDEALGLVAEVIGLLPACNMEDAPLTEADDLNRAVACGDAAEAETLMREIADEGRLVALYDGYGAALRVALARVGGWTVGLVASDYAQDQGRLTQEACRKAARFVRLCDCYHLPIVTLVNTDGVAVPCPCGQGAAIRGAAELLYAYAEATAPKVAVITGNAVGAAYAAMGGQHIADMIYAWPTAMIAPLTREAAVQTWDGEKLNAGESREALENAYASKCGALYAAQNGMVDDVIAPADTRRYVIAALELLFTKHDVNLPKKHGNLPL